MAIDLVLPDSGRVELTDTFRPRARALNGIGDSVQAQVFWSSLDTATLAVLDSSTGVSISKLLGIARLQARTGSLFSNPQNVTVLAKLDSIRPAGPRLHSVVAGDSLSDSLSVQVFSPGVTIPTNRRVVFSRTTFPSTGPIVTLVPDSTILTNSTGAAAVRVLIRGPAPDSVVVTVTMQHVNGTPVQGSPVTFVVVF